MNLRRVAAKFRARPLSASTPSSKIRGLTRPRRRPTFADGTAAMPAAAYSYRDDPAVPAFDDTLPIVIFDGFCVLCTSGVQWMIRRDPSGSSRFAVIQDPLPRALYRHYGLDPRVFDTFMVLSEGIPHTRWAGALAAVRTMPQPWRALAIAGRL